MRERSANAESRVRALLHPSIPRSSSRPRTRTGNNHRLRRHPSRFARPIPQPVPIVASTIHRHHLMTAPRIHSMDRHPADQPALQRSHILHRLPDSIRDASPSFHVQHDGPSRTATDRHLTRASTSSRIPIARIGIRPRTHDRAVPQPTRIFPPPTRRTRTRTDIAAAVVRQKHRSIPTDFPDRSHCDTAAPTPYPARQVAAPPGPRSQTTPARPAENQE